MKILIISDTHSNDMRTAEVMQEAWPFDAVIHAGDAEGSEDLYEEVCGVPFYFVAGNNDFYTEAPYDLEFELEGHRFYLTHGHRKSVHSGEKRVLEEAVKRHADIAVYGHTHRPSVTVYPPGITVINPGSIGYPRQAGRRPSYCVMDLVPGKAPDCRIFYLR